MGGNLCTSSRYCRRPPSYRRTWLLRYVILRIQHVAITTVLLTPQAPAAAEAAEGAACFVPARSCFGDLPRVFCAAVAGLFSCARDCAGRLCGTDCCREFEIRKCVARMTTSAARESPCGTAAEINGKTSFRSSSHRRCLAASSSERKCRGTSDKKYSRSSAGARPRALPEVRVAPGSRRAGTGQSPRFQISRASSPFPDLSKYTARG